jgi:integrase
VLNEGGAWVTAPKGVRPLRWRARTKFRDDDGKLRDVERYAPTKARAEAALKAALKGRSTPQRGKVLRADMTVEDAGRIYLEQAKRPESGLAPDTVWQYTRSFNWYVVGSSIARLTLREVNRKPVVRQYLQEVADTRGSGAAKTARSIVSNIINLAVADGVLEANACRGVRPARSTVEKKSKHDKERAFTRKERDDFLEFVANDKTAQKQDVVDIVRFMAGTGCRISEALNMRWSDVDLDAGAVVIPGTKSARSRRRPVSIPTWLADALRERRDRGVAITGLVFPSVTMGGRRDYRNTARQLRVLFDKAGYEWAVPHTFRRTVASLIDQAGLGVEMAANVLGHADGAMTARHYLNRKSDTSAAARVL